MTTLKCRGTATTHRTAEVTEAGAGAGVDDFVRDVGLDGGAN